MIGVPLSQALNELCPFSDVSRFKKDVDERNADAEMFQVSPPASLRKPLVSDHQASPVLDPVIILSTHHTPCSCNIAYIVERERKDGVLSLSTVGRRGATRMINPQRPTLMEEVNVRAGQRQGDFMKQSLQRQEGWDGKKVEGEEVEEWC